MKFTLNADELTQMEAHLRSHKWIAPDEQLISAKKAGEGNMNYTLRVRSNFRSFILKQSRPYVEKYPQIPAPIERALIEAKFYETIQQDVRLYDYTPELVAKDPENFLIQLEDLGSSDDFSFLYQKGKQIKPEEIKELAEFLSILHGEFNSDKITPNISNRDMRALNAEHIFNYPFLEENGFNLDDVTPGLQELAMSYKTDDAFKSKVGELSKYYLEDGPTLLHGDFYPGSWLQTIRGVKVIDPEFGFFGIPEFDLSVWIAHFHMAEQEQANIDQILVDYAFTSNLDTGVLEALAGVEIMRRLIGLAQLPLTLGLAEKENLLKEAYRLIMK
ncbi:MAG: aminoglycoside phosphotransferase [Bacteroidota bacterium]